MEVQDAQYKDYLKLNWPYAIDFIETLNGLEVNVCLDKALRHYNEGNISTTVAFLVLDFFVRTFEAHLPLIVFQALVEDQKLMEQKAKIEFEAFKHFHLTNIKEVL